MQTMETEINAYRLDDELCHSPVWIWYTVLREGVASCLLCNNPVTNTKSNTTSMIQHLRNHHNSNQSYNAWIICEELVELRKMRMQTKKAAPEKLGRISHFSHGMKRDTRAHQNSMKGHTTGISYLIFK